MKEFFKDLGKGFLDGFVGGFFLWWALSNFEGIEVPYFAAVMLVIAIRVIQADIFETVWRNRNTIVLERGK